MKYPSFYDKSKVGTLYLPNAQLAAEEGLNAGIPAAINDKEKVLLINVDFQGGFVFPFAALPVPGAVEDVERTIDWIFRNIDRITTIASSLDSHLPFQIFYPGWFVDENGNHPAPFTMITADDLKTGKWRAVISPTWTLKYLEELEKTGKKQLMIWPYHTMIGSADQALVPALFEAVTYHAVARHAQPMFLVKGSVPQTENYSIVEPEVKVPNHPAGGLNTAFLDLVAKHDLVYVAGEAKSHCVLDTMRSIVNYFAGQKEVLEKIRFLMDCTSSVFHPDVDFEAIANAELKEMEKLGVRLVKSTDPIG